jgi:hypothetical protein
LFLRLLLFSALLIPCPTSAQSSASDPTTRPAILGSLEKGKYSNPLIGFELQLDPDCTFADEARAIAWSTQLSQRLSLALRCGDNPFLLSSFPVHADEKINLKRDAQASLQGRNGWRRLQKAGGVAEPYWEWNRGTGKALATECLYISQELGRMLGGRTHAFDRPKYTGPC